MLPLGTDGSEPLGQPHMFVCCLLAPIPTTPLQHCRVER